MERPHRLNHEIRVPLVHLILADGSSRGQVPVSEALRLAQAANLDLVEISPKANPPVCRILDYNKFRYEQEKKARQSAKNAKNPQLKEMRLSFGIGKHDIETKAKRAREFLDEGHFVRVYIQLRGRQNIFPQKAKETLIQFQTVVDAATEQPVSQLGNKVLLTIKPKKS